MVRFSGTNITNQRYMVDTSNTFGGTHWADPFMCSVQLKYGFTTSATVICARVHRESEDEDGSE